MKKGGKSGGARAPSPGIGRCRIESLVTIDERGQMVLPKDLRERAGLRAGDKLAVIGCESEGRICCIALVKAEEFAEMVRHVLGPLMKEVIN